MNIYYQIYVRNKISLGLLIANKTRLAEVQIKATIIQKKIYSLSFPKNHLLGQDIVPILKLKQL